jgi:hypothetical protein
MTQEKGKDPARDHSLLIGVREDADGPGDGFSAQITSYGPGGAKHDEGNVLTIEGVLERVRRWLEGVTRR